MRSRSRRCMTREIPPGSFDQRSSSVRSAVGRAAHLDHGQVEREAAEQVLEHGIEVAEAAAIFGDARHVVGEPAQAVAWRVVRAAPDIGEPVVAQRDAHAVANLRVGLIAQQYGLRKTLELEHLWPLRKLLNGRRYADHAARGVSR